MARRGFAALEFIAAVLVVVVIAGLVPLFLPSATDCRRGSEISNLKQHALAVLMYAGDWDDTLPLAANWSTASTKYLRDPGVRYCMGIRGAVKNGQFGHAMHEQITGVKTVAINDPQQQVMLFDSMDLWENAVSGLDRVPPIEREYGQVAVAFVDSHVQRKNPDSPLFSK